MSENLIGATTEMRHLKMAEAQAYATLHLAETIKDSAIPTRSFDDEIVITPLVAEKVVNCDHLEDGYDYTDEGLVYTRFAYCPVCGEKL